MTDKKELRKLCCKKRSQIENKQLKSRSAADRILDSDFVKDAELILVYVSVNSEADTFYLMEKLIECGKKIAVPKSLDDGIMTFHVISSADELVIGRYDIPEPPENAPAVEIPDKTVCIVPALAFTANGNRLGYGGGYYDRFLAANPQIFTVGLTYEEMILDSIPVLPHDLSVNAVVTEERMVFCNA